MMMSPLNILSTPSQALSNSSSNSASTLESAQSSTNNRSPDNCSHHDSASKSPPSPTLPPNPLLVGSKDHHHHQSSASSASMAAAAAANNAAAASLLHAAIAAGNVPAAMSTTLAQMFPGSFPLHVAAAAAAAFYGNAGNGTSQNGSAGQSTPASYLYAQQQQNQQHQTQQQQQQQHQHQLSALLANAARMTPNAFLGIHSGKKLSELSEHKLSPPQANHQAASHLPHTASVANNVPTSHNHSPNAALSAASIYANHAHQNRPHPTHPQGHTTPSHHPHVLPTHPLMPLTNMMAKHHGGSTGHLSPQTDTASTSSSRSSSGHHVVGGAGGGPGGNHSSNSSSSLLSPILFSPLSHGPDSSGQTSFAKQRKNMLDVVGSEVASTTAESPYTANYHRIASRTPSSPPMGQSGPNSSNAVNHSSSSSSSTSSAVNHHQTSNNGSNNNGGVLHCPICSISLDGIDINQHFFEEMHKIDSMRKLPDWSNETSGTTATTSSNDNSDCSTVMANGTKRRSLSPPFVLDGNGGNGKFPLPPPPPPQSSSTSSGQTSSYQKKLQLPQSRWETFQRIRQNRHARLAAFMRLTRRKYEAAYESSIHQQQSANNNNNSSLVGGLAHHPHHHSASSSSTSSNYGQQPGASHHPHPSHHHHHHNSHQQNSQHHSPVQRSPNLIPSHSHHPFDFFAKSIDSKISPNSGMMGHPSTNNESSSSSSNRSANLGLHSPPDGNRPLPRTPPTNASLSAAAAAAAYQAHSLFAQNPAFLPPFYPYHSTMAFPSAGYGAFPPESFFNGPSTAVNQLVSTSSISNPTTGNQQPKIWRSVDTDQLEADDERSKVESEEKQPIRSSSNDDLLGRCGNNNNEATIDVVSNQPAATTNNTSDELQHDLHSLSPVSSIHSSDSKHVGRGAGGEGSNAGSEDNSRDQQHQSSKTISVKKQSSPVNSDVESDQDHVTISRGSSHSSQHNESDGAEDDEPGNIQQQSRTPSPNSNNHNNSKKEDIDEDVDVVSGNDHPINNSHHHNHHQVTKQQQQQRSTFQMDNQKSFKRHYADVYHEEMLHRKRSAFERGSDTK